MVEIISYSAVWQDAFKQLNLEWLDKYNLREEADMILLNNPQATFLDKVALFILQKPVM
jgi:hypothetical protein